MGLLLHNFVFRAGESGALAAENRPKSPRKSHIAAKLCKTVEKPLHKSGHCQTSALVVE